MIPLSEPPLRSVDTAWRLVNTPVGALLTVMVLPLTAVILVPSGIPSPISSRPTESPAAEIRLMLFPETPSTAEAVADSGIAVNAVLNVTVPSGATAVTVVLGPNPSPFNDMPTTRRESGEASCSVVEPTAPTGSAASKPSELMALESVTVLPLIAVIFVSAGMPSPVRVIPTTRPIPDAFKII